METPSEAPSCTKGDGDHSHTGIDSCEACEQELREQEEIQNIKQCSFCQKYFPANYEMDKHLQFHLGDKPFSCLKCDKLFSNGPEFGQHILKLHKGLFCCNLCDLTFSRVFDLNRHALNHRNEDYSIPGPKPKRRRCFCVFCDKSVDTTERWRKHMLTHANKERCEYCFKIFISRTTFLSHFCFNRDYDMKSAYGESNTEKEENGETENLDDVPRSETSINDTESEKETYSCASCRKTYVSLESLRKHIMVYHGGRCCDECSILFSTRQEFDMHNESVHKKQTQCILCGTLCTAREFVSHLDQHVGQPPFECAECRNSFLDRNLYITHLLSKHRGKIPCNLCGLTFACMSKLETHSLRHKGRCPCRFCNKRFKFKSHRYTHELTHLTTAKFKCQKCLLRFQTKTDLTKHDKSCTAPLKEASANDNVELEMDEPDLSSDPDDVELNTGPLESPYKPDNAKTNTLSENSNKPTNAERKTNELERSNNTGNSDLKTKDTETSKSSKKSTNGKDPRTQVPEPKGTRTSTRAKKAIALYKVGSSFTQYLRNPMSREVQDKSAALGHMRDTNDTEEKLQKAETAALDRTTGAIDTDENPQTSKSAALEHRTEKNDIEEKTQSGRLIKTPKLYEVGSSFIDNWKEKLKGVKNGTESFCCDFCGASFASEILLKQHMTSTHSWRNRKSSTATGSISYVCSVCGREFSSDLQLKTHKAKHDKNTDVGESVIRKKRGRKSNVSYVCHACGKQFSSELKLKTHRSKHKKVRKKWTIQNLVRLKWHLEKHSRNLNERETVNRKLSAINSEFYVCKICDKKLGSKASLKSHMFTHVKSDVRHATPPESYVCTICDKKLRSKYYLKYHMLKHAKKSNVTEKPSSSQNELETGNLQISATSSASYVCTVCDKKLCNKYYLKRHILKHAKKSRNLKERDRRIYNKPSKSTHICTICNKRFCTKYYLKAHILKHTGKSDVRVKLVDIMAPLQNSSVGNSSVKVEVGPVEQIEEGLCNDSDATDEYDFETENSELNSEVPIVKNSYQTDAIAIKKEPEDFSYFSHVSSHTSVAAETPERDAVSGPSDVDGNPFKMETSQEELFENADISEPLHQQPSKTGTFPVQIPHFVLDNSTLQPIAEPDKSIKPYKCFLCNETFSSQNELNRHFPVHKTSRRRYQVCNICFVTVKCLAAHKKTHDAKPKLPGLYCKICNKSFRSFYYIGKHTAIIHGGSGNLDTAAAIKSENTSPDKIGVSSESNTTGSNSGDRSQLGGTTQVSYSVDLNSHLDTHGHISSPVTQSEIPVKQETDGDTLQQIVNIENQDTSPTVLSLSDPTKISNDSHQCYVCHATFASERLLASHFTNFHANVIPQQEVALVKLTECDICFKYVKNIVPHKKTHTLPHKCTICGASFSRKYRLRNHMFRYHVDIYVGLV